MNDITIRFLEFYNYLKSKNIIHSPKAFANEINVSTSLITEICKERTNAGITPIQNTIARYEELNPEWLIIGKGQMLKKPLSSDNINFKELAESRKEIIDLLKEKLQNTQNELSELKKEYKIPENNLYVAEPSEELKKN